MKYLILGSRGQIGSSLSEYLINEGQDVEHFDIVDGESFDLRVANSEALNQAVSESDFVFFLAFDVGGSTYLSKYQHSYAFLHNNMRIMANTFETLKHVGTPFLFASSQMSNMSDSPYGITKLVGELYARQLDGLIVKFWNVYGFESNLDKAHVITDFILKALLTHEISILTDGQESRQFLYADDCSRCLYTLSKQRKAVNRDHDLHVTNFQWTTIVEIAESVANIVGNTSVTRSETPDQVQGMRRNEPDTYILKHWRPTTELGDGIRTMVRIYSELLDDETFRKAAILRLESLGGK